MENVKISFILPIYNVEKYLEQCVDSILEQDYKNIEIILVDDGSPDNSSLICDRYAEKYDCVKVIHKRNSGLSDTRNLGVENATGDYILFVDSDDFIEKDSLKDIVATVVANPVDVVFLEAQKYFEDNSKIPLGDGITKVGVFGKNKNEVLDFISGCPKYPASAWAKLIKRELFVGNELLFESGLLSEDLDWCIKLFMKASSFDYCPTMYYNYRQNRAGSITNSVSDKRMRDFLFILEKWSELAENKPESEKNFILSQMAYELPIVIYLYGQLKNNENKAQFKTRIKNLCFLLKYKSGLKYKGVLLMCKLLGVDITSKVINLIYKTKRN